VHYHKRKYLLEKQREHLVKGGPLSFVFKVLWQNPAKRRAFHQRALFEKGYQATRVVGNTNAVGLKHIGGDEVSIDGREWAFISITADGTNVTITAPANIIDGIAEEVRHSTGDQCDDK
jgi:hypothetical protein